MPRQFLNKYPESKKNENEGVLKEKTKNLIFALDS
jgi:hypothetical protein